MQMVDNAIILILIALAFLAGKRTSDSYNQQRINELIFQLRLRDAEKGVGYVAPPPQKKRYMPIGQPFMDRLKNDGKAIQQFTPADISR